MSQSSSHNSEEECTQSRPKQSSQSRHNDTTWT